jgi:glycosyltransferase involved in cell wall biosynthesis
MSSVRFINYHPLEAMGGGEVTAITVGNALATEFDVEYLSAEAYSGQSRVTTAAVATEIKFRYRRLPFVPSPCRGMQFIARPLPPLDLISPTDVTLLFVDRPVCGRYLAELGRRTRLILLLHGLTIEKPWPFSGPRSVASAWTLGMAALQWTQSTKLKHADVEFQVFNPAQIGFLNRMGIPHARIHRIPTGVDFDQYSVDESPPDFRVAFVGRIDRWTKGIARLCNVIDLVSRYHPDIGFDLMGAGPDAQMFREAALRHSNVVYHGFVPQERKNSLLARASAIVVTSDVEPYSLATVEGLASGLPVVSTDVSGPAGIISLDPSFGTLVSGGARAIAGTILRHHQGWQGERSKYGAVKRLRRERARPLLDLSVCTAAYGRMIRASPNNSQSGAAN